MQPYNLINSAISVDADCSLTVIDSRPNATHSGDNASLPAGGVITGVRATYGMFAMLSKINGVINNAGNLNLFGGTITGNTANNYGGVYNGGTMTVGGSASVYGNTVKNIETNLYLFEDNPISIATDENAFTSNAIIGVTLSTGSGQFTDNGKKTDEQFFFSDNTAYADKYNSDGYLELVTGYIVTEEECENGSVSSGYQKSCYAGEAVTLTTTPNNGYKLDKIFYKADGQTSYTSVEKNSEDKYVFDMPEANVSIKAEFIEKPNDVCYIDIDGDGEFTENDTTYETINDAITAAGANEVTIILLENVTENFDIPSTSKIILDLNGKTITPPEGESFPEATLTITYNKNISDGSEKTQYYFGELPYTIIKNTYTYEGYTFNGWATSPSGSVEYKDCDKISNGGQLTLYAVWGKKAETEYSFDTNMSEGTNPSLSKEIEAEKYDVANPDEQAKNLVVGVKDAIKSTSMEKLIENYIVDEAIDQRIEMDIRNDVILENIISKNEQIVELDYSITPYAMITSYINGKIDSRSVYQKVNNSDFNDGSEFSVTLSCLGITPISLIHTEKGKIIDVIEEDDIDFDSQNNTVSFTINRFSEIILLGVPAEYSVTYKVDGEIYGEVETHCYTENLGSARDIPKKEGYTFSGWSGFPENGIMPLKDVTIEGTFTVEKYNVITHLNGLISDDNNPCEVEYHQELILNYKLPENKTEFPELIVKVGGTVLKNGQDYIWNPETGELKINEGIIDDYVNIKFSYGDIDSDSDFDSDSILSDSIITDFLRRIINTIKAFFEKMLNMLNF